MMRIGLPLLIFLVLAVGCRRGADPQPKEQVDTMLRGVDVSFLPAIRQSGRLWQIGKGEPKDMLLAMQQAGVNLIRLRVWNADTSGFHSPARAVEICAEARALGLKTILSLHYSDSWADPAQQRLPAAWQALDYTTLCDSVFAFTARWMAAARPDYVQIGNEINAGFLWPHGSAADTARFHGLLRKGIAAARKASPQTQIVLHYAGLGAAEWFFLQRASLDYDIAALSYYPIWHGKDTADFARGLAKLHVRIGKPVLLAETAYPFTLGWKDQTHNVLGLESQCIPAYGASPAGQLRFMQMIDRTVRETPGVLGFCYWGAEWVAMPEIPGSSWENQALWDFQLQALPAWKVFAGH